MRQHDHSKLLLAIILLLIFYIFHIHLAGPRVPRQAGLIQNGDEAGAEAPGGTSDVRIAIVTMNTVETSYDILSLSNKFCTRF
jgi:hypothetical protein